MSKVDWSLAPDDAEIYSPQSEGINACWYKIVKDKVYCWPANDNGWSWRHRMIGDLIYRPKQPKPWSGPEDGLPPVGMVCEAEYINAWLKVECIGHYKDYAICVREYLTKDDDEIIDVDIYPKHHLRTICHGAKLAASSRETAIRELMDIAQADCRVTAARLVDAGFKREVV